MTTQTAPQTAPITNVYLLASAIDGVMHGRSAHRISVFYGSPGLGKTQAAAYCTAKFDAIFVRVGSYFSRRTLIDTLCHAAELRPGRTVPQSVEILIAEITANPRPIIVDEFDFLAETRSLEILRDIHDQARAPLVLIGEDTLPRKLAKSQRFYDRVVAWHQAQPATIEDTRKLAALYLPDVDVDDEFLSRLHAASRANPRRICSNLEAARELASKDGLRELNADAWGDREFFTGLAPLRSVA